MVRIEVETEIAEKLKNWADDQQITVQQLLARLVENREQQMITTTVDPEAPEK